MIEFKLDQKNDVPFHHQIMEQIRSGITKHRLSPGERLPTVRELAVQLQVNPNTIRKAYSKLKKLGILDSQQGYGTFISHRKVEVKEDRELHMLKLSWVYSWLNSSWI